jgi:TRAP-type C4-dicarboxylate transport system permease small subunit
MSKMRWQTNISRLASQIERGLDFASRIMAIIAAYVLAIMVLLTAADVSGRYFFNRPIPGAWELIGLLLVCAGTFGLAYCQIKKRHIRVTFLFERLSPRLQAISDSLAYLIGFLAFSIICWQSSLMTRKYFLLGPEGTSFDLDIIFWPFWLTLVIGTGMLAIILLLDLLHSLIKVVQR